MSSPLQACTAALALLLTFISIHRTSAHAGLDERMFEITTAMVAQPRDAALWLERADLHRRHNDFKEALADLDHASELRPGWPMIALGRARIFQDQGRTPDALSSVQSFLASTTNHPGALILRAQCFMKQHKIAEGVADYSTAISLSSSPSPDLYLERARAQAALGRIANAVKGLDEGLARLGEIASLQLAAIEYSRQLADFDSALVRLEKLTIKHPVKEPWLVLRGEILSQAGRLKEAKETFQQTLAGIEDYPPTKRGLEQTIQLRSRTCEGLERVETRLARQIQARPITSRPNDS